MTILSYLLAFMLAIGVLVAVHEYGHFWMARRVGVRLPTRLVMEAIQDLYYSTQAAAQVDRAGSGARHYRQQHEHCEQADAERTHGISPFTASRAHYGARGAAAQGRRRPRVCRRGSPSRISGG
jgi:hypothetical protein